jgi:hypothetical protein
MLYRDVAKHRRKKVMILLAATHQFTTVTQIITKENGDIYNHKCSHALCTDSLLIFIAMYALAPMG